ncbi:MAG: hypothetical protein QG597_1768 [Actinomycetota bacterium]|nr:hypothetical protein [Actinomycetota bacterium]
MPLSKEAAPSQDLRVPHALGSLTWLDKETRGSQRHCGSASAGHVRSSSSAIPEPSGHLSRRAASLARTYTVGEEGSDMRRQIKVTTNQSRLR